MRAKKRDEQLKKNYFYVEKQVEEKNENLKSKQLKFIDKIGNLIKKSLQSYDIFKLLKIQILNEFCFRYGFHDIDYNEVFYKRSYIENNKLYNILLSRINFEFEIFLEDYKKQTLEEKKVIDYITEKIIEFDKNFIGHYVIRYDSNYPLHYYYILK